MVGGRGGAKFKPQSFSKEEREVYSQIFVEPLKYPKLHSPAVRLQISDEERKMITSLNEIRQEFKDSFFDINYECLNFELDQKQCITYGKFKSKLDDIKLADTQTFPKQLCRYASDKQFKIKIGNKDQKRQKSLLEGTVNAPGILEDEKRLDRTEKPLNDSNFDESKEEVEIIEGKSEDGEEDYFDKNDDANDEEASFADGDDYINNYFDNGDAFVEENNSNNEEPYF